MFIQLGHDILGILYLGGLLLLVRGGIEIYALFRWPQLWHALKMVRTQTPTLRTAQEYIWVGKDKLKVHYALTFEQVPLASILVSFRRRGRELSFKYMKTDEGPVAVNPNRGRYPIPWSARGYLSRILNEAEQRHLELDFLLAA